jgi:hypothetical protein
VQRRVFTRAAGFPTRTSSTTRFSSRSTDIAAWSLEVADELGPVPVPGPLPLADRCCCGDSSGPEARFDHAAMIPPVVTKSSSVSSPTGYASKSSSDSVASSSHPSFLVKGTFDDECDDENDERGSSSSFSCCEDDASLSSSSSRPPPLLPLISSILMLWTTASPPLPLPPPLSSSSSSSCHGLPRICDSGDAIAGDSSRRSDCPTAGGSADAECASRDDIILVGTSKGCPSSYRCRDGGG